MSTLQYSFVLAAKRQNSRLLYLKTSYLKFLLDISFSTEIWSLFLVLITQDFPFFVIRIFILFTVDLTKNFTIYFLVSKNFILILIEAYRIHVIYVEENKFRNERNHNFKKRFKVLNQNKVGAETNEPNVNEPELAEKNAENNFNTNNDETKNI